ncbi:DsbA family protein [Vibrio fluvialis]|nr:DsbA family protein [Vibrio fluvialis]
MTMKNVPQRIKRTVHRFILVLLIVAGSAQAQLNAGQVQQLDEINTMLKNNPQLIENLYATLLRYEQQQTRFDRVLSENQQYLYFNPDHPSFGADKPALTIVFFTDYSCPWCKKLDPVLRQLSEKYPQIKVVSVLVPLKELAAESNSASFALNVWHTAPDKFTQVESLLVAKPGAHNPMSLVQVAKKTNTLNAVNAQPKSAAQIEENYLLFSELGMRGTPAMLIGDDVIPGYLPLEQLEELIKAKLGS